MHEGDAMSQEDQSWTNRRKFQRVSTDAPVRISTIEPERDPWTGRPFFRASHETCANVSRGGAFVKTAEPIDPGRRLLIEVHLPNGVPLEAIGRVAWTKRVMTPHARAAESGIGIEFIGGASDQFAALEDYIVALADRGSEAGSRAEREPSGS
jgi:Tfp pilus assembly protein PilZ